MRLTPAEAKAHAQQLGIDLQEGTKGKHHGEKVKADKQFGESVCRSIGFMVGFHFTSTHEEIIRWPLNYQFDLPRTKRELDLAFPDYKVALELQGFAYHTHRKKMHDDYQKLADATLQGWRVFFCSAGQAKKHAALWLITAIEQERAKG